MLGRSSRSAFQRQFVGNLNFARPSPRIILASGLKSKSNDNEWKKHDKHQPLRRDVKMLGKTLGQSIEKTDGKQAFDHVEKVRLLAKNWREGKGDFSDLPNYINTLDVDSTLVVSRAFTHFLALANTAENHHRVRMLRANAIEADEAKIDSIEGTIDRLINEKKKTPEEIYASLIKQKMELVLTAHPTEVNRRTFIRKHQKIAYDLYELGFAQLSEREKEMRKNEIAGEIANIWGSDEIRRKKPSPLDEAAGGITVINNVLWDAVPNMIRNADLLVKQKLGKHLPVDVSPIKFASWMGGDRDGNPNVTPQITRRVAYMCRWEAAKLFLKDITALKQWLSVTECNDELRQRVGDVREPYRILLKGIEKKLKDTEHILNLELQKGVLPEGHLNLPLEKTEELMSELMLLHRSLIDTDQKVIADGMLTDTIRRLSCFGLTLLPLDIRQESVRHTEAIDAITRYLGVGSYQQWDEESRVTWLLGELNSKRPLLPHGDKSGDLGFDPVVTDVLQTYKTASELGPGSLGAYVISMAHYPSDVLAVMLLQKEFGMKHKLRVVPLFETLDDLDNSMKTMETLFSIPWYRGQINGKQEVMIGYSDSAKDAGRLAALWGQYEAQENLANLASKLGIELTFFHGKGGTVSRGGNPSMYKALIAQPPNTVNGRFRITEQGEVITQNFGHKRIAERTLDIYYSAMLCESFKTIKHPTAEMRAIMGELSEVSCDAYRQVVRKDPRFVPYFRQATPELELAALNVGSRPAKRRPTGGVETLRAIPWVFAWGLTRLHLPAWLGVGEGLSAVLKGPKKEKLQQMYKEWPFFQTNLDLVNTIIAKAEIEIAENYDKQLVTDPEALELGRQLRENLVNTSNALLNLSGQKDHLTHHKLLNWALSLRNAYVDPLNVLQAHILRKLRNKEYVSEEERLKLEDALIITINGVSAGMRNTG